MTGEKPSYSEEIDLKDLIFILYRKRWFIVGLTLAFLILSLFFWYMKSRKVAKEQTFVLSLPELVSKEIPFPSVGFPQVWNKNFFSANIQPVIRGIVKVKTIPALNKNFLMGIELTGTPRQLEDALQLLGSKIIEIVRDVLEREALSSSINSKLLQGNIEEKKEEIFKLEEELKALKKFKAEFKGPGKERTLIVLSPEMKSYLDWETQVRGLQYEKLKAQLEIEDMKRKLEVYLQKKDLIERILNRKEDYQQKGIFVPSRFCQVLKEELSAGKFQGALLAQVYYMRSYTDFLCDQLKWLKEPVAVRPRSFSKNFILIVTVLGFFVAVFLSFVVEFFRNLKVSG